jgi:predicted NAD-dependent protein-ADP-ribosyltransferase YbiA (DUF1768 family)
VNKITEFQGPWREYSNFEGPPVQYGMLIYDHVENAFQAAKSLDPNIRRKFMHVTPSEAKRMGHEVECRADWEKVKLAVLEILVREKFLHRKPLGLLLASGEMEIEEGNMWHDNFFGICRCNMCSLKPKLNNLGKLLMKIRGEMQNFDMIYRQKEYIEKAASSILVS